MSYAPKFMRHIENHIIENKDHMTSRSENVIETIRNSPKNKTSININFP